MDYDQDGGMNKHNSITLSLEHALVPGTFTPRGQISFKNANLYLLSNTNKLSSSLQFSQTELSKNDINNFQKLINNNENYQIRIKLPFSKDSRNNIPYVSASVPACLLKDSNFEDLIKLNLDQFGNLIGVEYRANTQNGICNNDITNFNDNTKFQETFKFDTKVRLGSGSEGPKPLKEEEIAETQQKQNEDNRSFLAKYWYYIVPAVLILIAMAQIPPDEAVAGGNTAGAAQSSTSRTGGRRQ